MQIQIGVNQKMKLYNVYRICKQNLEYFQSPNLIQQQTEGKEIVFRMENWTEFKERLKNLRKLSILKDYIDNYFNIIPIFIFEKKTPVVSSQMASQLNSIKKSISDRMETVLNLYEGMNLKEGGNGIDIKMPSCEYLDDYIKYLEEINFIFSQCPFLQCDGEVLKFESVDVGSNWLKLTIATTTTCMLLNNTAALVDKANILRSHYISLQQQEEMLKSIQLKNELTKEQVETYNLLRTTYMNAAISLLENDLGNLKDPEERDRAERSLEKLINLLDKGCEIYATLDSPEEIQLLFPEIQSSLELSDDIIKYLEDKEKNKE